MITKMLLSSVMVLSVTGCATAEYQQYTTAQIAMSVAKHNADAKKYEAMSAIAASGDTAAKVAAVMAMAMGNVPQPTQQIAAPQNQALQWASILLPSLTQFYSIAKNADVAIAASTNSRDVALSTNSAFVGMAGKIQAPQANYTYGANSGAYSGTSSVGDNSGAYSGTTATTTTTTTSTDDHAVTNSTPVIVGP